MYNAFLVLSKAKRDGGDDSMMEDVGTVSAPRNKAGRDHEFGMNEVLVSNVSSTNITSIYIYIFVNGPHGTGSDRRGEAEIIHRKARHLAVRF